MHGWIEGMFWYIWECQIDDQKTAQVFLQAKGVQWPWPLALRHSISPSAGHTTKLTSRTPQGFVVRCFTVSNRKDWFLYWDNFLQNAWPRVIGCVLLLPVSLVDLRRSVRSMEVKWGLNFQSGLLFSPWEVRGSTTIPNSSWCPSWQADLSREELHLL